MEIITCHSLVDITPSNVTFARDANTKEYHQMQNLNVLAQIIGLRTQIIDQTISVLEEDLGYYNFHSRYKGKQRIWKMLFTHEQPHVWSNEEGRLALLNNELHGNPITSDLDNTVEFPINIFDTLSEPNIYFQI